MSTPAIPDGPPPAQPVAAHPAISPDDYAQLFDIAPVSLWLEDYSELRALLERWRAAGVRDLRAWLRDHPEAAAEAAGCIRIVAVNRRTLELFGAASQAELVANLGRIFRDDMHQRFSEDLVQMWDHGPRLRLQTVNYTLDGRRLELLLNAAPLAGHEDRWSRVLVSLEDISERERARFLQARSEAYARGLFEHSPVSLWVEDFSGVKSLIDGARAQGIQDMRTFLNVHPEFVERCMRAIRVMDINRQTLKMFAAPSKEVLLTQLEKIFRDEMRAHFAEQLVDLWDGRLFQQRETVNYALGGEKVHVYLQFSVMPGHEQDWALVLVSLTDITARKQAEAYLEFLGRHDALTKLRNRAYYDDEIVRLQRHGPWPVGVLIADLIGLKQVNDTLGHAAGDSLLQRAAEVLGKALGPEQASACCARTGGDEFALLLPGAGPAAMAALAERVEALTELNNQFYQGARLQLSLGWAACEAGGRLDDVIRDADARMYEAKRRHYAQLGIDRRERAREFTPSR